MIDGNKDYDGKSFGTRDQSVEHFPGFDETHGIAITYITDVQKK